MDNVDETVAILLDNYGKLRVSNVDDRQMKLRNIIENIARVYPISRNLAIRIIEKIQLADHFLLNGIDVGGIVLKRIDAIFDDLRGENNLLTRMSAEYSELLQKNEIERKK